MTSLVGMVALAAGLVLATTGTAAWALAARGHASSAPARYATYAALACAAVACAALEWALVTHDFSVRYVAEHGGLDVPLYYTVTSLWGALEGSLLLWLLTLTAVAVAAMRLGAGTPGLHRTAMAVVLAVTAFFFALALGGGNAFHTVSPPPPDGPGPNPLLQDHPAMGVHPPLLYLGFVGLTVPFAYSVAALLTGRTDRHWLRAVRGWSLFSWWFLTAGILLGAWWAYAVLGWGGYWAWDPVENASLLPWLTTTALLHSARVPQRWSATWTLWLSAAGFVLVLLGTFLTRSGVVDSVHAFTRSPLGPMLLGFLVLVMAGWLLLALGPGAGAGRGHQRFPAVLTRGGAVLAGNLLLGAVAFTVLLGTLFPLAHRSLTGTPVSVGPPYFSAMVTPVALLLLLLMGTAPLLPSEEERPRRLVRRVRGPLAAGAVTAGAAATAGARDLAVLLAAGGAGVVVAALVEALLGSGRTKGRPPSRRRVGALVAHTGVALAAVAVTVSSHHARSVQSTVAPGEPLRLAGVTATLLSVDRTSGADRMRATARVQVAAVRGGTRELAPELTFFPAHELVVATPAIRTGLRQDVYLTVLEVDPVTGNAVLRLAVNPLVGLLWFSGGVVLLGAGLAAWPSRGGRGAPLRVRTDRLARSRT